MCNNNLRLIKHDKTNNYVEPGFRPRRQINFVYPWVAFASGVQPPSQTPRRGVAVSQIPRSSGRPPTPANINTYYRPGVNYDFKFSPFTLTAIWRTNLMGPEYFGRNGCNPRLPNSHHNNDNTGACENNVV